MLISNPSPLLEKHGASLLCIIHGPNLTIRHQFEVGLLKTLFIVSDVNLTSEAPPADAKWSFRKDIVVSSGTPCIAFLHYLWLLTS